MKSDKYMGMDVHQAMTVVVVLDAEGKVVLETMVPTEAAAIIRLVQSLSGPLRVTFEETTQAAWLHEVIRAYLTEVIVCDPRRNKLLEDGSKADKVDARKLAELLRAGLLRSVYHGHEATLQLKELVRAYETLSIDTVRTMARIKAIYRGRAIRTPGRGVYQPKQREPWLPTLTEPGIRQHAAWLYEQLDQLQPLRRKAKPTMLIESRAHRAVSLLRTIRQPGPIRAAFMSPR
jgi:transposase